MEEKTCQLTVVMSPEKHENDHGKKSFFHVNRDMLPYKTHFFLLSGGVGAILPFLTAIGVRKLGLTASNIAATYTIQQVLFIFVKPYIGYIADYFKKHKAIIIGLTVLLALSFLFMINIPKSKMTRITGHPSFHIPQTERYKHKFCHKPEDFENVSSTVLQKTLDRTNVVRIIPCFNGTGNKYILKGSYKIMHVPYHSSDKIFHPTVTSSEAPSSKPVLLTSLSSNSSQNTIVCFVPEEVIFLPDSKLSPDSMSHIVAGRQSKDLQKLLPAPSCTPSLFKTFDVDTLVKGEYNERMSAANFGTYQFWAYTLCVLICWVAISSVYSLSDAVCYESTPNANYGRQRAFGPVAWGLTAPLAGFLNDYTKSYTATWCLTAVMFALQIWNLSRMNLVKPDFSQSILRDMKTVFSSVEFLAFEAAVFINGIFLGVILFYLPWFLSSIGGNELVIGLAHTVQCYLGEVPFLFISNWLIQKLGHFNVLSLALLCYCIRFFIYSYLRDPWWILPVEISSGITYGSFLSAMTSYAKLNAKPGTEATTQSVLCTTFEGLGCGMGCLIFGICFDYYGGHTTFFYASFVCGFAALVNSLSTILILSRKGRLDLTKASLA